MTTAASARRSIAEPFVGLAPQSSRAALGLAPNPVVLRRRVVSTQPVPALESKPAAKMEGFQISLARLETAEQSPVERDENEARARA
jgi:hypothetical protein